MALSSSPSCGPRRRRTCSPTLSEPPRIDADGYHAEQPVTRDGRQARRRGAATVAAVGRAAKLARRDLRRQVRRDSRGHAREDAFVRRLRRLGEHVEQPFGTSSFGIAEPQGMQIVDDALPVGGPEAFLGDSRRSAACRG